VGERFACRWSVLLAALAIGLSSCGAGGGAPSLTESASDTATTTSSTTTVTAPTVTIVMPAIPQIALPDISELTQTGDVVGQKLGDLISPISGVDLLTASCEGGGALVYQGTTGTDVFAIAQDGSGEYHDESENGLVTLQVAADGSGQYYDATAGGLVTIKVAADGSGEYYSERPDGKVTVKVTADGSGVYYDDRGEAVLTVTLPGDRSGQLYHETADGLLTIDVRADGSGEYYYKRVGGELTTLEADGSGRWKLTEVTSARLIEITVEADSSGHYRETGLAPSEFDFDPQGEGREPNQGRSITVPDGPVFSVAGRFPPLGKLGSLSPPCATVIRFEEQLLFDFNEATLRPEAGQTVDQVVAALNQAGKPIEVNGHTDSMGADDYNLDLSLQRAQAVERALRERGLNVDITVNGLGESQPIAPNTDATGADDPAGRTLNRRVEIVIRD
jgi:OmpA-OmpF porin, OOP family